MSVKKKNQVMDIGSSSQQSLSKNSSTTSQDLKSPPLESINAGSKLIQQNQIAQQTKSKQQQQQPQDNVQGGSSPIHGKKPKLESKPSKELIQQKKRLKSILICDGTKGNNNVAQKIAEIEERKDQFGTAISKNGKKQHRIQFSDEIEEVHEVENWKEYNIITENSTCCAAFQTNFFYCAAA